MCHINQDNESNVTKGYWIIFSLNKHDWPIIRANNKSVISASPASTTTTLSIISNTNSTTVVESRVIPQQLQPILPIRRR